MKKNQIMKRALACLMVVLMTVTAVPLSGFVGLELPAWSALFATKASAATEGYLEYEVEDGEAMITGCDESISGNLVIPDKLGGYPVTIIGDWAFYNCIGLISITIPDSVTRISDHAFSDCTGLTSIKIPDSVTSIGNLVFLECTGLTNITIPDSVTSIGVGAFEYCAGLTSVTIPNNITRISDYMFCGCTGLKSITIPDCVISIGSGAFEDTAWYNAQPNGDIYAGKVYYKYKGKMQENTSIIIKKGTKIIADSAFEDSDGLKSITIPDGVTSIGNRAFFGCTGLKNITIGNSVTSIGRQAFGHCYSLPSVTIPNSVISIGAYAFNYCTGLTSVTFGNSVTNIGYKAFSNCTNLASVTIPDSVISIEEGAFEDTAWYDSQPDGDVYAGSVYYKYKGEMPENTCITIKKGTKSITDSAFCECTNLEKITIPDSVMSIGVCSFMHCESLISITIPDSVISIGLYAFRGCTGLTSITIPDSVYDLNGCSFDYCSELTSVTIGNGVETISSDTFNYCPLTTIKIGKNVKYIGENAFSGIKKTPEVYYSGSKADWEKISIHKSNEMLLKANMHYAISEHTHSYTSKITKAATCTEKGVKTYTCSCGNSYTEAVAATNHKNAVDKAAVAATCTAKGYTAGKYCPDCKTWISGHQEVAATGKHTYKTTTTAKATTAKDGKIVTACTVCGKVSKTTPIYKASSIKLSATKYTYNGKVQTPTVTVKDSKGNTLKNGTDYTVKYDSGRKNIGKYSVTVTFKGDYTGNKKLSFNIILGKTAKLTATQTTSSVKATWKAVTGADGYKVTLYSAKNKAIKTVYTTKTTASFTKLSKGTTYKVRVTAYKTVNGKKDSSSVYAQLTTATKPGTPTLKVTAGTGKAALSWNKQTGATGYVVYMATSKNGKYTKIATVKGNTKVSFTKTGLTKGKTYYFKVAAYETVGGKTVYGSYSSVRYAKIK